jgi:hypothetical protein
MIVFDRGTQFTSRFCERLHEALDTQFRFNSAYHPQTDGQTERVNQILEDILKLVLCNMEEVGIRVCRMLSFPTTIVIKRV